MTDLIIGVIVLGITGIAIGYIYKAKKKGVKCIGCPSGASCGSSSKNETSCGCCCGCNQDEEK